MGIFQKALAKVEDGQKFKVDLKERTLKVENEVFIYKGQYQEELGLEPMSMLELISFIEQLYHEYKHSLPSQRSESKRKKYFNALSIDELSFGDLTTGIQREVAQFRLEAIILINILNGSFVWDEETLGKWFWQSSSDKDLIILKEWIV